MDTIPKAEAEASSKKSLFDAIQNKEDQKGILLGYAKIFDRIAIQYNYVSLLTEVSLFAEISNHASEGFAPGFKSFISSNISDKNKIWSNYLKESWKNAIDEMSDYSGKKDRYTIVMNEELYFEPFKYIKLSEYFSDGLEDNVSYKDVIEKTVIKIKGNNYDRESVVENFGGSSPDGNFINRKIEKTLNESIHKLLNIFKININKFSYHDEISHFLSKSTLLIIPFKKNIFEGNEIKGNQPGACVFMFLYPNISELNNDYDILVDRIKYEIMDSFLLQANLQIQDLLSKQEKSFNSNVIHHIKGVTPEAKVISKRLFEHEKNKENKEQSQIKETEKLYHTLRRLHYLSDYTIKAYKSLKEGVTFNLDNEIKTEELSKISYKEYHYYIKCALENFEKINRYEDIYIDFDFELNEGRNIEYMEEFFLLSLDELVQNSIKFGDMRDIYLRIYDTKNIVWMSVSNGYFSSAEEKIKEMARSKIFWTDCTGLLMLSNFTKSHRLPNINFEENDGAVTVSIPIGKYSKDK